MNERATRLDEQMEWLIDAPLESSAKVEALLTEIAIFFDGGPPAQDEEALVMEARVLATLHVCPTFTPRIKRYLNDRLRGNAD